MAPQPGPTAEMEKRIAKILVFARTKDRTLVEIAKKLGISEGSTRRTLDHARERGVITKLGKDDRSTTYKAV